MGKAWFDYEHRERDDLRRRSFASSRRASAATPTPEGGDAVFEGEEQRTNSATTTSTTNTSIGNGADIASAAKLAGVVGKDFVEGGREVVATDGEHDIGLVDSDSETWSVDSVR